MYKKIYLNIYDKVRFNDEEENSEQNIKTNSM